MVQNGRSRFHLSDSCHLPPPKLHPCRPPHERACGQAGEASGDPRSTGMQVTRRPRPAPWQAAFIRAAKLHPYRRHRRQSGIPAAPSRAGARAGGRGHRPSRSTGMQAIRAHGCRDWAA